MAALSVLQQPQLFLLEEEPHRGPEHLGRATVGNIQVKQILTKANGSLQGYDYSLNPYVGCGFACSYCFASFFQPDEERFAKWGTWIDVKANAVELLKKKDLKGARIFMSSATDPYQPLEAKVGITREMVEVMTDPLRQPRLTVQTRSPLVERDFDLLKKLERCRVNMSITTDSDVIRKRFEPSCASIEQRMSAIAAAKAAGLRTTVCMCPMLPIVNVKRFAADLKALKADHYVTCYFHKSDRAFAANTREQAWSMAVDMGWDYETYKKTAKELKRYFPKVNDGSGGFEPA